MSVWFAVYLLGSLASSVGPWPDNGTCDDYAASEQARMRSVAATAPLPPLNGMQVHPADITVLCLRQKNRPPLGSALPTLEQPR